MGGHEGGGRGAEEGPEGLCVRDQGGVKGGGVSSKGMITLTAGETSAHPPGHPTTKEAELNPTATYS